MMTLRELMATFPTDEVCKQFLHDRRWPKGVHCPRCNNEHVYKSTVRPWSWECKKCPETKRTTYRFSVTAGTIFENTKYPLKTWFEVLWQMLNSKKGVSAMQVQRQIGCKSYETAFYMCHRLRAGMRDPDFKQLMGIVEVDEVYLGGKNKNRHKNKQTPGRGPGGKISVVGAIARKGNVVAQVVERMDAATLSGFVKRVVSKKVELVATDENAAYKSLPKAGYAHESVSHRQDEYVRGIVHTANIDSFWSLLKRGVMGTYHNVSKKYLPLYLAEFQFRHNNRENADMFGLAIAGC